MFEYIWYVLNNPEDVEFYHYIPIIIGVLVIVGIVAIIKWGIRLFRQ